MSELTNQAMVEAVNQILAELQQAARDGQLIQNGYATTEVEGRSKVADGETFKVAGSGDVAALLYRRIDANTSTVIAIYPSAQYIIQLREDLSKGGLVNYNGAGPIYPISTDKNGKILLGFDSSAGKIVGVGLSSSEILSKYWDANYIGSGSVYPIMTDNYGRVLLGYDSVSQKIIGAGLGIASQDAIFTAPLMPLDSADRPIAKENNHLLLYGQSLSLGTKGVPILSTTQPYKNITFIDGPRGGNYSSFMPLIETELSGGYRGETPCSGAANWATTLAAIDGKSPDNHVILASTAGLGSAPISTLKKGSAWYNSTLIAHISNAKALNPNYALHVLGWLQGEQDAINSLPYTTYRNELQQLRIDVESDAKSISGQSSPVYLVTYQLSTSARVWPDQALAQLDLSQKNSKFVLATPCYHLPFDPDNVHLTAAGYKWLGAYFGRAYKQLVIDGVRPKWLNPISATRRGAVIRVRFDVPVLPLVLDTTSLASTTDHGFKVLDGADAATISSVKVDGSDVVITLSSVPAGEVKVRYALDYLGGGLTITNGASGNLRDSEPSTIKISGVERPLYNVCPHFQLAAIAIGE